MFNRSQLSWISSLGAKSFSDNLYGIFISFFIWQSTSSLRDILVFNFAKIIIIPIAGTLAAYLAVKYSPKLMYRIGLIFELIVVAIVAFMADLFIEHLIIFGAFRGMAVGLYAIPLNTINDIVSGELITKLGSIRASINNFVKITIPSFGAWLVSIGTGYSVIFISSGVFLLLAVILLTATKIKPEKSRNLNIFHLFSPRNLDKDKVLLFFVYFFNGIRHGFFWALGAIVALHIIGGMSGWGIYNFIFSGTGMIMGFVLLKKIEFNLSQSLVVLINLLFSVACLTLGIYFNLTSFIIFSFCLILLEVTSSSAYSGIINQIIRNEPDYANLKNEYFCAVEYPLAIGRLIPISVLLFFNVFTLDDYVLRLSYVLIGLIPIISFTLLSKTSIWTLKNNRYI